MVCCAIIDHKRKKLQQLKIIRFDLEALLNIDLYIFHLFREEKRCLLYVKHSEDKRYGNK